MAKQIIILNGSPRKNGATKKLIGSFIEGAETSGNNIREFCLNDMNIHGCAGCLRAGQNPESPCSIKDDMDKIYSAFVRCDTVVFASPIYFWTITGQLKTATDRLYAELECLGYGKFARECALIMTADGSDYSKAVSWYRNYENNLGWKNLGEVLGKNKEREAYNLGVSI